MTSFPVRTERGQVWVALRKRSKTGPWWYDFHLKGKRFRDTTETTIETEAKGKASEAVEKAMRAEGFAPLTLRDLCDQCLDSLWPEHLRSRHKGFQDHRRTFKQFCAENGGIMPTQMTVREFAAIVQKFLDSRLRAEMHPQTIRNDRTRISRLCSWLIQRHLVPWESNPINKHLIRTPDIPRRKPVGIAEGHIKTLVTHGPESAVWGAIVLCLGVGLRPIEAERVKWSDIDFDKRRLRAYAKRRERVVELPPWAEQELKKMRPKMPKEGETVVGFTVSGMAQHLQIFREEHRLPSIVTFQRMRQAAAMRAAPHMSTIQYANHFGHSLAVAHAHYLGYGITGDSKALKALDFGRSVTRTVTNQRRLPKKKKA